MSDVRVGRRSRTSTWLGMVLMNLNPGIRLSLHTTPTSSVCLQSDIPIPLDGHWANVLSFPVQWTLSNQICPDDDTAGKTPVNLHV